MVETQKAPSLDGASIKSCLTAKNINLPCGYNMNTTTLIKNRQEL